MSVATARVLPRARHRPDGPRLFDGPTFARRGTAGATHSGPAATARRPDRPVSRRADRPDPRGRHLSRAGRGGGALDAAAWRAQGTGVGPGGRQAAMEIGRAHVL